ncbi:MAG TPA: hypothetical protein VGR22_05635 [Thermomicrobiales bacterium]|nr:hypothetical protein [Thermomicrobiales bacterium]
MTISRGRPLTILFFLLATAIGVAIVPLAPTPGADDPMDTDFVDYMQPRLSVLLDSAREVEGMVSERSRNLLALRAESARINALLEQIDTYLAAREPSPEEQLVADLYRAGADNLRLAIDTASDALSRFDFSAIPEMIPVFTAGTELIEESLATMGTEQTRRSSYTGTSVV